MTNQLPTKLFGFSLIAAGVANVATAVLNGANSVVAGANVGVIAFALSIPALLAIVLMLYRSAPTLALTGGIMAAFGTVAGVLWMALPLMGDSAETQLALPLYVGGLMYPLAIIVLAVGLLRHALAPSWVNITLIAAAILFTMSWFVPSLAIAAASAVLLAIAYGWLGVQMWSGALPARTQLTVPA